MIFISVFIYCAFLKEAEFVINELIIPHSTPKRAG